MTTKTKRITIDRSEFNRQQYDNIKTEMIDKEQNIPFHPVMLKVLHQLLVQSKEV